MAFILHHIKNFPISTFCFDRMNLRRLAKLQKNPRARLNLSVSPV